MKFVFDYKKTSSSYSPRRDVSILLSGPGPTFHPVIGYQKLTAFGCRKVDPDEVWATCGVTLVGPTLAYEEWTQHSNPKFWYIYMMFSPGPGRCMLTKWKRMKENSVYLLRYYQGQSWTFPSLFLMVDLSIHPNFWQMGVKLQLAYIPKVLRFRSNFLELETQIYSILKGLILRTEIRL
jgi:hypothetical protein